MLDNITRHEASAPAAVGTPAMRRAPDAGTTLVERLLRHARVDPGRPAVTFLNRPGPGETATVLTYGDLVERARRVAAFIEASASPEEPVLLLYPPGVEFVVGLVGCFFAGVPAVPAPLPGGRDQHARRTTGICGDSGATTALTDLNSLDDVRASLHATDLDVTVAASDLLVGPVAEPRRVEAGTAAFLQYTSGSTSEPKGVVVSHGNLSHNLGLISGTDIDSGENTRTCSWLPHYHDMGLVGMILTPLYLGGQAVLMSPLAFLRRFSAWPETVSRHRCTSSAAPNFAYDLCARFATDEEVAALDLSSWRHAFNGAEPIAPDSLERFARRFEAAGFTTEALQPSYGMAEATLYISGIPYGSPPVTTLVDAAALEVGRFEPAEHGCGPAAASTQRLASSGVVTDLDVRIVDPTTAEPLSDGHVGEIWVRGRSVSSGYWRRPRESAEVFGATTAAGEAGYLRTGDLGARWEGHLYVTGRIKELLIFNGRNLHPHDVEREVRTADESLADTTVCAITVPGPPERLVIVQELSRRAPTEPDELRRLATAIRTTVGGRLEVRVHGVLLVAPGTVRRTTSGKLQRMLMRDLFLRGALEVVHEELS